MMRWTLEAAEDFDRPVRLLGITVLTSMNEANLKSIGVHVSPAEQVEHLGQMAYESGMRGLVCSPLEVGMLRKNLGNDVALVIPGIRPAGSDANEQKRIMTPAEAVQAGASVIVVGRPIYKAADPAQAVANILTEMEGAYAK